ncbi:Cobalt/zinc/cadmium efflux RND transporter, membrane fusion protein, CzcB family [Lysobacter dokdonensis DS-58]|uniref:Cobalt/zinc/cadmium efflux RND transporter, membrane fusion protein, CzcB family n=1 Tax=Lysobacter dokdonensis DS-58 TaxID=1300345 RepID=A0A0A2WCR7_9GAMM|nr:Cobalt/zinc/cadmium efflux RND transporter, membrane fusion protein, CzcB family [Lysobacter dokdonensis DS-58]
MKITHRAVVIAAVSLALMGAAGAGYWWGRSQGRGPAAGTATSQSGERKVLYWYDPMVPDQHFDKPGKSPFMDMQMVPKYADEAVAGGISIAPNVRQNLGIRTTVVKRSQLDADLRVPGTIGWDLRQERVVSARVDTIVERLHIRAPFEPVRAGQPLASIIAPSWNTAIAEAQALGGSHSTTGRELQSAAHARLRALGVPAGSGAGPRGQLTLTSPVTGVVSEIGVREGQSAPAGTLLFRINGTRTVWLEAAIPQAGLADVAAGTPVEAAVDAFPGQTFRGRVEVMLPQIDTSSRTQRARIVLGNPNGALAPGMFAQVALRPTAGVEHPVLPTEALIGAGTQARVIVLGADDSFHPVAVQTGRSSNGMTEILAGLQGGERVVVSGQFLIDSEANLSGALERLNADKAQELNPDESDLPRDVMPGMPNMTAPQSPAPPKPATRSEKKSSVGARPKVQCRVLYWFDPMVPDKHFKKPGKSPFMDMQLVPKFAPEASPDCTIRDVLPASERQP